MPGRIPLADTRRSGVPILLDFWPQNSYAGFCFIKRGLNSANASVMVQPSVVLPAACGKQVALGQKTASAAYAVHTTGAGPAASGLAGSLAVYVAGARSGDPAPPADVASAARESECPGRLAARADARLFTVRSAHAASCQRGSFLDGTLRTLTPHGIP